MSIIGTNDSYQNKKTKFGAGTKVIDRIFEATDSGIKDPRQIALRLGYNGTESDIRSVEAVCTMRPIIEERRKLRQTPEKDEFGLANPPENRKRAATSPDTVSQGTVSDDPELPVSKRQKKADSASQVEALDSQSSKKEFTPDVITRKNTSSSTNSNTEARAQRLQEARTSFQDNGYWTIGNGLYAGAPVISRTFNPNQRRFYSGSLQVTGISNRKVKNKDGEAAPKPPSVKRRPSIYDQIGVPPQYNADNLEPEASRVQTISKAKERLKTHLAQSAQQA